MLHFILNKSRCLGGFDYLKLLLENHQLGLCKCYTVVQTIFYLHHTQPYPCDSSWFLSKTPCQPVGLLTSMMKSVNGFRPSFSSCLLTRSRLCFTRKMPRVFSSLEIFNRRSSLSTSSGPRNSAERTVIGLGALPWDLWYTWFISSILTSAGRPGEGHQTQVKNGHEN